MRLEVAQKAQKSLEFGPRKLDKFNIRRLFGLTWWPLMNQASAPAGLLKSLEHCNSTRSPAAYKLLRPIKLRRTWGST